MKDLLKNEDWLSFAAGLSIIILAIAGIHFGAPKFGWASFTELGEVFADATLLTRIGLTALVVLDHGFSEQDPSSQKF